MNHRLRLDPKSLLQRCDPEQLPFMTTDDLKDLSEVLGQSRAMAAIQFGISIHQEGYNLFAIGSSALAKHSIIRQKLQQQALNEAVPWDWCYINNFEQPHKPFHLKLPTGRAAILREDFERMVAALCDAIPTAFESEDYQKRKQAIEAEYKARRDKQFAQFRKQANEINVELLQTSSGPAFAPLRNGVVLSTEEFDKLPISEQRETEQHVRELQERMNELSEQVPQLERECRDKYNTLIEEITTQAVSNIIDDLKHRYNDLPVITGYLELLKQDVIENADMFLDSDETDDNSVNSANETFSEQSQQSTLVIKRRYQINVLVDNSSIKGAPVIYEDNPTYQNLIGKIEHISYMGSLLTDFSLIKAGALHKANGGYLILDAHKVLSQPFAWEGLKRALRAGKVQIESWEQMINMVSTVTLEPEAIPLNVKVILLGDTFLYYQLYQFDPEFKELFKVMADFNEEMERNAENHLLYARLLATLARKENLQPLERHAVARVIEYSSRLVGDAERLSMHMKTITDLLREADYFANQSNHSAILIEDIEQALKEQEYRASRLNELTQSEILRGTVLIDTVGEKIGQLNGLSVYELGNYSFGRPCRITATVRAGEGEVLDIEREVELGGPIHSKGIMILSGYLASRYLPDQPLTLSARIVFEQSYNAIEGDSASSAELYTLLSALANLPIKQSLAVTGSVNQYGQIQPIGAVNEKIEGFFAICQARGLTGEQGVIIPAANVKHLMLKQSVIDAVAVGKFHIYAVETIDQGIEFLAGVVAGERDKNGKFPANSVNCLVEARLCKLLTSSINYKGKVNSEN